MKPNTADLWLQRFVDEEMADEEERAFLLECESHPERWRTVALQLVERRTMAQWMRDDVKQVQRRASATTARVMETPRSRVSKGRGFVVGFVVAASLLAVLGVALSRRDGGSRAETAISRPNVVVPGDAKADDEAARPANVFKEVVLTSDDGTSTHPVLLPVYQPAEVSEDASSFAYEEVLPKSVLDRLAMKGLRVQTERRWTYISTEPGRGVLVPEYIPKLQPIAYSGRN
jgi:hypothetical protein